MRRWRPGRVGWVVRFRWLDWFWFLRHGLETLTEDLDKHDHCCYQAEKNRERLHCPAPKRRFGYS